MTKILTIFSFLLSLFVLFSCEPGRDANGDLLFGLNHDPQTGGGVPGVKKYLKSVTATDDAGETLTFSYNYQLDKLISVRTSDNSVAYDLTYDNNNISEIKVMQDDGGLITTTNYAITYMNGKFTEAKGEGSENTGNSFKNTITASYAAGKVSKIVSKMVGNDITDPNVTYDMFTFQNDVTYSGNNISDWKFTTTFPPTPPVNFPPIVISAVFSDYDSNKNPFNTLPEVFNIVSSVYGTESTAVTGFSTNNYRKITVEGQTATYVYTYDSDGYPTKSVASGGLGTLTFEYTK